MDQLDGKCLHTRTGNYRVDHHPIYYQDVELVTIHPGRPNSHSYTGSSVAKRSKIAAFYEEYKSQIDFADPSVNRWA